MAEIDNEPESKQPKAADTLSSEYDSGYKSGFPGPDYFEYSDFKTASQLDRHFLNTCEHAIKERRLKLALTEYAIKALNWTPGKHNSEEVT